MPTITDAHQQIAHLHQLADAQRNQWYRVVELALNAADGDDAAYCIRWIRNHLDMIEASINR